MSILSRLFGGGGKSSASSAPPETYKDYTITPDPIREGSVFRLAAMIEKDGKTHHLIRADTLESEEAAQSAALAKAKQVIDEQGERIFE